MDIDLKLGSEFVADGLKLMVVEGRGCNHCFFGIGNGCTNENNLTCSGENRQDKTDVIFVESNLPETSDLPAPPEAPKQTDTRSYNVGNSDYSKHRIQPWDIWKEYGLNPFDADIVKRVLRRKDEPGMTANESRILDYKKIVHICQERINQLEAGEDPFNNKKED